MATKKKTAVLGIVRQGDVILIPTSASAEGLSEAPIDLRGIVLAEGETSGHHHQLFGRGHKLFQYRATASERLLVVGRSG